MSQHVQGSGGRPVFLDEAGKSSNDDGYQEFPDDPAIEKYPLRVRVAVLAAAAVITWLGPCMIVIALLPGERSAWTDPKVAVNHQNLHQ
jgi:hypothetical protein